MRNGDGSRLTETEIKALELHYLEGKTKKEAYLLTHNCQEKSGEANSTAFFRRAESKLSLQELLAYYNLGPARVMKEIAAHLKAEDELAYKGFRTGDKKPDYQARASALKLLAQINGMADKPAKTEIPDEGGYSLHIVIDNG